MRSPADVEAGPASPLAAEQPREVELKLAVPLEHVEELMRHPLLKRSLAPARSEQLSSVYFDTPDLRLAKDDVTLRVRRHGRRHIQTVKLGPMRQAGLFSRAEWEEPVPTSKPDPARIGNRKLRQRIDRVRLKRGLKPIFGTEFKRTNWLLKGHRGGKVAVGLDVGEIKTREGSRSICELELELKSGKPGELFEVAEALARDMPLRLEFESKASRGFALYQGEASRPVKACEVALGDVDTTFAMAKRTFAACFDQLAANWGPAVDGSDPEGVHQLRVAIRRFRSALGLFRELLDADGHAKLRLELGWLAQELAPARAWDVFLAELLPSGAGALPVPAVRKTIVRLARRVRKESYERARAALASKRGADLLLALRIWVDEPRWRPAGEEAHAGPPSAAEAMSARDFARHMLHRRHKRVRRFARNAAELSPEALHALRIQVKKLRYAAEFVSGLFPRRRVKSYLRDLARLQQDLGAINDAVTLPPLAGQLLERDRDARLAQAVGALIGWHASRAVSARTHLGPLLEEFADARKFWS
ncbi:MAG: CHAD domain-containing protein [Proteobacteria bacterium]|nr:CHAD domain-containing protein [Pseudomonadota bacterium]MBI3496792.1 CHAD domain-containing protein [Pseudomonadota bacterium]